MHFVRSSTNKLKFFEFRVEIGKMTRGRQPLDVKIIWNSTYFMLKKAMFILPFQNMEDEDKPNNDYLWKMRIGSPSIDKWEAFHRFVHFLIIF